MSTEFYAQLPDGSRLTETAFIQGLPDPLRFELVKTYTVVACEWRWKAFGSRPWTPEDGPLPEDGPEEDVEVHGYRIHGAEGDVLWAFFWRKQEWEEGQLQRFERFGGNKVVTILETLAKGFELSIRDEMGFNLGEEVFNEVNG